VNPVNRDSVRDAFARTFEGRPPTLLVRAPGRVNLIGEHTDYNDGFVLPVATTQALYVAAAPREDRTLRVHSANIEQTQTLDLDALEGYRKPAWINYVRGVAAVLIGAGEPIGGADLLIDSHIPVGGGLSSSAALEVGVGKALLALYEGLVETTELATLCRKAENDYANVPCGIMDQYAVLLCQAGCALLLDCRTRTYQHVPIQRKGAHLAILDSRVKHDLAASEYPLRQQQCRQAVEYFARLDPAIRSLRDVSVQTMRRHLVQMDPVAAARASHVITENQRVLDFTEAVKRGDLAAAGACLNQSHLSLRDQFQVSCAELDDVVAIAQGVPGVYGARMTGGGFGGCAVALLRPDAVEPLRAALADRYDSSHDQPAVLMTTQPVAGADWSWL